MKTLTLAPGESIELVHLLGQCADAAAVVPLLKRMRSADRQAELAAVQTYWDDTLGDLRIETPDRAMDIMVNGWLPYQALACRIEARAPAASAGGRAVVKMKPEAKERTKSQSAAEAAI